MLLRILLVAVFLAWTTVTGFVYFRWDSLPSKRKIRSRGQGTRRVHILVHLDRHDGHHIRRDYALNAVFAGASA
jgi:hypothetical protein